MLPNPKGFVNFFLGFQAPNIIPTYFHSSQTTTTLQSTFLLSTIYQGLLILLLPKKVVRAKLLKILVENMFGKKNPKGFDFPLLKRRKEVKEDPHLVANGRRRRRFLCSEANGRRRRRFLCSEANGRRRKRFLCSEANGRRRKRFLCSEANGKRRKRFLCSKANGRRRKRFSFTSSHFPPKQLYLDLQFFPLTLRFYFTIVLGHYLHISSHSLGL